MNFLAIAQQVRSEAGVSGTGPDTVTGQTGIYDLILKWVNQAWVELQIKSDSWHWMRATKTFNLSAGTQDYSLSSLSLDGDLRRWRLETAKIYKTADGADQERYLTPYGHDGFTFKYKLGDPDTGSPVGIAVDVIEDQALMFGPTPDDTYTVTIDYQEKPSELSAAGDEPDLPEEFHSLLLYRALMFYARYDNAPEIYETAREDYNRLFEPLWHQQRPTITMGKHPLS